MTMGLSGLEYRRDFVQSLGRGGKGILPDVVDAGARPRAWPWLVPYVDCAMTRDHTVLSPCSDSTRSKFVS